MASSSAQKQRSIFASILIPLVILLLAEIVIFAGIMSASGVFTHLNDNNKDILDQQVRSRKDNIENYLVGTVGDLSSLAGLINVNTQQLLDAGELDLSTMDAGASETTQLVDSFLDSLVSNMRTKRVSGAFVIFNTHNLAPAYESGAFGKKPGVYIRDMDPAATPSSRNEDLVIERGSADVINSSSITTDNGWKPLFDFTNRQGAQDYDFFYLPWQTAYEAEGNKVAQDYAYWGISPLIGAGSGENMVYVIPLILDDGTVYGVLGVDLASSYLRTLLPSGELFSGSEGVYILGMHEQETKDDTVVVDNLRTLVSNSAAEISILDGQTLDLAISQEGSTYFQSDKTSFYANCEYLRLYDNNAPFENKRWVLLGAAPETALHRFSNQVLTMIGLASLLMLAVGAIGSIMVGRRLSNPIRSLANDVENAQVKNAEMPALAATGIAEVDSLTGAITSLSKDIASVRKLEQQRLEHERDYDLLTGLINRRTFYRRANDVLSQPEAAKYAALVTLDIDDLKNLNDAYGHDWGDKYIYQAARCFEEAISEDTLVARVAGDEFFILYSGFDSREKLEDEIDKLRAAIPAREVLLPGGEVSHLSVSGGVAFYPDDARDYAGLMKMADFAMYQAKIAGKNSIAFFNMDNYQEQSSVQSALQELESLFENYELTDYHFQPIVNAKTGEIFAYEALMRVDTEHLHSPADVLTLARQQGRLASVEQLTWLRSFECFNQLQNNGSVAANTHLFVNSFANVSMDADSLAALTRQYSSIMRGLVIEITEAENMDTEAMEVKRAIPGFSGLFALDDYGSGYNSEIMLLDLKPKYVKVDISIIRDVDTSIDKQRIVANVVSYAHERSMYIIAEGVETPEEFETLRKLDVDYMQGFYLAMPARVPGAVHEDALKQIKGLQLL